MSRLKEKHLHQWVRDFISSHRLINTNHHAVLGFSGGKDSMLLSYIISKMVEDGLLKSFQLVHVNHNLRSSSGEHANNIKSICRKFGWPLEVVSIDGRNVSANVELWARNERYKVFNTFLSHKKDCVLLLGHHINDSFEWYIKQMMTNSFEFLRGYP